ncbi:MAG TPA: hypothetical protein ENH99_03275, partial [Candidatus Pacearchaeota archaeon]|nr:hypothetical protein [Candidatus Pacearchaeota archaeon]
MKIDKEKFNKLKQLDRIEFRQRSYKLDEDYDFSFSWSFIFGAAIIGLLFILISLNTYQMGSV